MTLFTPSAPDRVVTLQQWFEGFSSRTDLRFFMHRLTHEFCAHYERFSEVDSHFMDNYMSARHAVLLLPNQWRLSIVTMVPGPGGMGMFHGDPLDPSYEVMVVPAGDIARDEHSPDPDYNLSFDDIDALIRRAMVHPIGEMNREIPLFETGLHRLPPERCDPEIHGSFVFADIDHYRDDLWANRVSFPQPRWNVLRREAGARSNNDPYEVLRPINRWCAEHCREGYAWTMGGPMWVFESPVDAALFKVVWL